MKSIRLPETDLANLSFRSREFKTAFLSNWIEPKRIQGSYEPLRQSMGEAAHVSPLLPLDIPPTSLEQLELLVIRACKGDQNLINMNLAPVRSIRRLFEDKNAEADFLQDLPLTLYSGMRYSYWIPMIVRYNGRARFVFFDLRRKNGLQENGLVVCFSAMNERFRALSPEYRDVLGEVWRFKDNDDRTIEVISDGGKSLSFDAIRADVADKYQILTMLRTKRAPRTGTDDGPLFEC